jgi:predicted transposase YbfD/YdcC
MECITILAEMQVPAEVETVASESLYEALKRVKDKRSRRGKRYPAAVVLTLLVLAKLAGQVKLKGIAEWVAWQAETFAQRLPLYRGQVPCANTYRYVSDHIDVAELNTVLGEYFAALTSKPRPEVLPTEQAREASAAEPKERCHLAVDGKSLRGTRKRGEASKATVHTVGLYNVTGNFMWKQQTVAGKGQERQAAMSLIEPLAFAGSVVSADALHTQPKWAQAVLDRGGDYLLIAKGNQSELRAAIALLFSQPLRPQLFPEGEAHTVDKAHGRLEVRHLRVSNELGEYLAPRWPQVAQVFQIERTITRHGKTTHELVYGLTSLNGQHISPAQLLALVRQHWHIENRSHWRRDVTLGEDACRVTVGQVPQVLAALNNCVLAIADFLHQPNLAPPLAFFVHVQQKPLICFCSRFLHSILLCSYSTFALPCYRVRVL